MRLSAATRPTDRPATTAILHFGPGVFHRAHQAVFTEDAGGDWGICGVTQRSPAVVDQLRPQDGLFTVLERDRDATRCRVVGTIREVLFAAADPDRVRARFADPGVRIVSMTVTEKGYLPNSTAVARLVDGLRARWTTSGAPVTVLSCDNLVGNGRVLRRRVLDACAASPGGDALADWITANVTFPCSVVDRLVPATTEEDRATVRALLGLDDRAAVVTEPYRQWVIEDDFAAGRPAWERAGALVAADVAPYEVLKLRLLNGTHSLLAYLGALSGHETIAAAAADPAIAEAALRLVADIRPTVPPPPGVDIDAYTTEVLSRFGNPALGHRTTKVAMDGSQKLPARLLDPIRERLAAGTTPHAAIRAVAAWMAYVAAGRDRGGRPLPLDDPMADRLRTAAGTRADPKSIVTGLLSVTEVFGPDLPDHRDFRTALVDAVAELLTRSDRSSTN